jgi:hypothetical protein
MTISSMVQKATTTSALDSFVLDFDDTALPLCEKFKTVEYVVLRNFLCLLG